MNAKKIGKKIGKKSIILGMTMVMVLGELQITTVESSAAAGLLTQKVIYEWRLVKSQKDIPTSGYFPLILANEWGSYYTGMGLPYWDDDDNWSWLPNNWDKQNDWYPNLNQTGFPSFETDFLPSDWHVEFTGGVDGKNQNAKIIKLWIGDDRNILKYNICTPDNDEISVRADASESWSCYTNDLSREDGTYGEGLSDGQVHLYHECSGKDAQIKVDSKGIIWGDEDKSYDDGGKFYLWYGVKKNLSIYASTFTVESGQVVSIKDNVQLNSVDNQNQDVKLIVEPGAVLSIEGTFYNNGTILNYGTVIVQKDSCIRSRMPGPDPKNPSEKYGSIICDGGDYQKGDQIIQGEGNLLVLEGGKIDFNRANGLFQLRHGATAEINGTLLVPGTILMEDSELYIRNKGHILTGYYNEVRFDKTINTAKSTNDGLEGVFLAPYENNNGIAILQSGECMITNDGKLTLRTGAVKVNENGTYRTVMVNHGTGKLDNRAGQKGIAGLSVDVVGTNVTYTETTKSKADGSTTKRIYYPATSEYDTITEYYAAENTTKKPNRISTVYRNGAVKEELFEEKSGSMTSNGYTMTFPGDMAFIVQSIVADVEKGTKVVTYYNGAVETVPYGADDFDLAYGDLSPLKANGIEKVETLADGTVVTTYLNGDIYKVNGESYRWERAQRGNSQYQVESYDAASGTRFYQTWEGMMQTVTATYEETIYPEGGTISKIYVDLVKKETITYMTDGSTRHEFEDGSYYTQYEDGTCEQMTASGLKHIWLYTYTEQEMLEKPALREKNKLEKNLVYDSNGWYASPSLLSNSSDKETGYAKSGEDACFTEIYASDEGNERKRDGHAWLTNYYEMPSGKVIRFEEPVWLTEYPELSDVEPLVWIVEYKNGTRFEFEQNELMNIQFGKSVDQGGLDTSYQYILNENDEIYLSLLDESVPCRFLGMKEVENGSTSLMELYAVNCDYEKMLQTGELASGVTVQHVMTIYETGGKVLDYSQLVKPNDKPTLKTDCPRVEYSPSFDHEAIARSDFGGSGSETIRNLLIPTEFENIRDTRMYPSEGEVGVMWAFEGTLSGSRKMVIYAGVHTIYGNSTSSNGSKQMSELMIYMNDGKKTYRRGVFQNGSYSWIANAWSNPTVIHICMPAWKVTSNAMQSGSWDDNGEDPYKAAYRATYRVAIPVTVSVGFYDFLVNPKIAKEKKYYNYDYNSWN